MIALFTAPPPSTVAQRRQHNAHEGFEHGGEVTVCGRGGWKFAKWLAAVVAGMVKLDRAETCDRRLSGWYATISSVWRGSLKGILASRSTFHRIDSPLALTCTNFPSNIGPTAAVARTGIRTCQDANLTPNTQTTPPLGYCLHGNGRREDDR